MECSDMEVTPSEYTTVLAMDCLSAIGTEASLEEAGDPLLVSILLLCPGKGSQK